MNEGTNDGAMAQSSGSGVLSLGSRVSNSESRIQDPKSNSFRIPIIGNVPREPLILVATLILFLISNSLFRDTSLSFLSTIFAILVVLEMFFFVGMEVRTGAEKHGWKKEALETLIALVAAIAIWFALCWLLQTSSPISAVVSCSMLPNLQRGDFVMVQGAPAAAYTLSMSGAELKALNGPALITFPLENGSSANTTINGSIFPYCLRYGIPDVCGAFRTDPTKIVEQKGSFTYRYDACKYSLANGTTYRIPCISSITFHGTEYLTNFSNDVIVYQPAAGDVYASVGDIVHRAMFRIQSDGKTYYLTRGDNNPILDLQVYDYTNNKGNAPVPSDHVRGKVILRVPYLGYYKLFLSGFFNEDVQCKTQLEFKHVN